jgi:hypothetical protein
VGSFANIGVQRRPIAANTTTFPNAAAQRIAIARNGTAAIPSTVIHSSTNSTGMPSVRSNAARIEWPACVSRVWTHLSTALRNTNAINK